MSFATTSITLFASAALSVREALSRTALSAQSPLRPFRSAIDRANAAASLTACVRAIEEILQSLSAES